MTIDLTKEERKLYEKCLGQCTTCMLKDVCGIQKKIKAGQISEPDAKPIEISKEFLKWWSKSLCCISLEDKIKSKEGWKGALKWMQKLIADGYSTEEIKRQIREELREE